MDYHWLLFLLPLSLSATIVIHRRFSFIVSVVDAILTLYYRSCGLTPCTVDLDGQTTMHFFTTKNHRFNKKHALVLVHGYGSNPIWQFVRQVGPLSCCFDLYIPDLLFFGKSYTSSSDRSEEFQARCVTKGLRRLGVERCWVYSISYGGWVGYRMAQIYPNMVEKLVIMSSGVGMTEKQKEDELKKVGREKVMRMFCPEKPLDIRLLVNMTMHRYYRYYKLVPDFFLQDFIQVMLKTHKEERQELVEYLLSSKVDSNFSVLTQETLLIWGEQDKVFPLFFAHQLQRYLGPKSKLEIIKDTGHAANIESPHAVNRLIMSFLLPNTN